VYEYSTPDYAGFPSSLSLPSHRYKYSPQHLVLKYPQSVFYLHVQGVVSQPYKTTGKIIVPGILIFTFLGTRRKTEDWPSFLYPV
jgi:hypothetical protein